LSKLRDGELRIVSEFALSEHKSKLMRKTLMLWKSPARLCWWITPRIAPEPSSRNLKA
jgi:hypothetical protein